MKKSLLLPALLLAACTVAPPQPPFKVGDVLVLTGTTKTAQPVNQKYTLSRAGEYADGKWTTASSTLPTRWHLDSFK